MKSLNILAVATKAPWPALDGGRFLLLNTLQALAAAGCRLTLVAPVDPARFDLAEVARQLSGFCSPALVPAAPLPPFATLLPSGGAPAAPRPPPAPRPRRRGPPLPLPRHALPAVRREVEHRLAAERFDVVHA